MKSFLAAAWRGGFENGQIGSWTPANASLTAVLVSDVTYNSSAWALRVTRTSGTGNLQVFTGLNTGAKAVTRAIPGQVIRSSIWFRHNSVGSIQARLTHRHIANTTLVNDNQAALVTVPTGTWVELTHESTVPVATDGMHVMVDTTGGIPTGVSMWLDYLVVTGTPYTLTGPNLAQWPGTVDFSATTGVASEYDAVILRATEGTFQTDSLYESNVAAAQQAGLRVGAYHFLRLESSGRTQADYFLETAGAKPGVLYVVDCETSWQAPVGTNPALDTIQSFIERILEVTGREPIVYTLDAWWRLYIGANVPLPTRNLWVANWRDRYLGYGSVPNVERVFGWQHTATGTCPGIPGDVCLNDFYVTAAEWDSLAYGIGLLGAQSLLWSIRPPTRVIPYRNNQ